MKPTRILLIITGIAVTCLAVIAVADLREAIDRSRQKQTMAAVRSWSVAIEKSRKGHFAEGKVLSGTSMELAAIAKEHKLPIVDGWGNPYRIRATASSYMIQAAGRDGIFETISSFQVTDSYDDDIAFANGSFIRYPEGI